MEIVNCTWEIENLNKKTLEITILPNESINESSIKELEKQTEYLVLKIDVNQPQSCAIIQNLGYHFIESQLSISKKVRDIKEKDVTIKHLVNSFSLQEITDNLQLEELLNRISVGMFSTDRIYIDPVFGPDVSKQRYINWIRSEFLRGSILTWILSENTKIGFALFRKVNYDIHGLLGGIFSEYQGNGYGSVTAMAWYLYAMNNPEVKRVKTKISSNNDDMLKLYNYYNFKIDKIQNVFIKHI